MKKINYIKLAILPLTFVGTVLLITSCGIFNDTEDTKSSAEKRNEKNFENKNKSENSDQINDAQFLVNAAEINLEEIQLGKIAQRKGNTMHVKELGKMMEDEHTKSQVELVALAERKNIAIPISLTQKGKDAYKKLNDKPEDDFDKAYADLMVKGHKNAISMYEKASEDSYDADIKDWANGKLPQLQTHLNHSIDCQKKCENKNPNIK